MWQVCIGLFTDKREWKKCEIDRLLSYLLFFCFLSFRRCWLPHTWPLFWNTPLEGSSSTAFVTVNALTRMKYVLVLFNSRSVQSEIASNKRHCVWCQVRYLFQELISGVSYCHALVRNSLFLLWSLFYKYCRGFMFNVRYFLYSSSFTFLSKYFRGCFFKFKANAEIYKLGGFLLVSYTCEIYKLGFWYRSHFSFVW